MKKSGWWLLAAALGLPGLAFAAHDDPYAVHEQGQQKRSYEVQANAGLQTYAGGAANFTQPGFAYGASVSGDVVKLPYVGIGAELGYLGSTYNSERLVTNNKASINENGGQALAKVGPELGGKVGGHLAPYAVGGINVSRINVGDEAAVGGLIRDSTAVRIPMGVGVDYKTRQEGRGLTIGARGTYSFSTNDNSFPTLTNTNAQAQWMALGAVGGSF
jgi:hypothetical protein